jgi:ubiquitin carboxyl-terminal hydrolase L5
LEQVTLTVLPATHFSFPKFENSLRKHNHLGLIHALLVQLAKKGQLDAAVTAAKSKMQERLAKARSTGQMEED